MHRKFVIDDKKEVKRRKGVVLFMATTLVFNTFTNHIDGKPIEWTNRWLL